MNRRKFHVNLDACDTIEERQSRGIYILTSTVQQIEDRTSRVKNVLKTAAELTDFAQSEAAEVDYETGFPAQTFERLAAAGLLEVPLAAEFGGVDLNGREAETTAPLLRLLKIIGRGNLAVGRVYEGHINALLLIALYSSQSQIEKFAEDARQKKIFGVWNTEAGDGVKIFQLENGNFRLVGSKTFASGTGFVERPFVNCAFPDGGWQMCVVPMETVETKIDESWWKPIGMRSTRSFKIDFSGVELTPDYLIGKPGDYYQQPWFSGGAVRFAAVQLGGAEALFDETRQYLRNLKRTDDPFQRARLGEMAIRIESGNLWLTGAGAAFDVYLRSEKQAADVEKVLAYVNLMRTAIEAICLDVMILCEKCVGARGLMRPLLFERTIRDLTIYLRQPAPDAALLEAGRFVLEIQARADSLWRGEI